MITKRYVLPNLLTVLNLICGVVAVLILFESNNANPFIPVYLVGFAALFDFLDGFTAKLLKATSEFGKQLDSLSDLISFGLAPSMMLYKLLQFSSLEDNFSKSYSLESAALGEKLYVCISLLVVVFSALRLARYNITKVSFSGFQGLPVPASALIVISVWITFYTTPNPDVKTFVLNPFFLVGLVLSLSFLMVSKIPMLSLKFETIYFHENRWRYFLIIGFIVIYIIAGNTSLPFIMLYYILLSVVKYILRK